jgi:hypothetical protein
MGSAAKGTRSNARIGLLIPLDLTSTSVSGAEKLVGVLSCCGVQFDDALLLSAQTNLATGCARGHRTLCFASGTSSTRINLKRDRGVDLEAAMDP